MEAIHPVRVMLFWDSKIARDAYGPYFTGVVRKIWTLPTTQMISHNELVRKILKYRDMDPNLYIVRMTMRVPSYMNNDEEMRYLWSIPPHHAKEGIHILVEFEQIQQHSILITQDMDTTNMNKHITTVTQMVSDELSMLYTTVNDDDDEVDESDGDDAVSSQFELDGANDPKEGELQTPINPINPLNPVTENRVPQWESSQWCNSARYDYTHSRAFLDIGSGSPIDDLVESGTIRLLDWNDSMTDIKLGMRFVDKVQAISAVRKWSISVGCEYKVMKSKNDTWTARCYHHSDDNYYS
ncbi:hypothetical protein M9H77_22975 [Catharanthus roseus]|uniref:Uncharacterized protein n=1 Tax=Catharanthus roseus TaxID=4058 RepID=A0ACC0AT77_CATRO|nr:hypothetical protein M9H77_22975 [Catharanthus roseus]